MLLCFQMAATDEDKAEAAADVDDEFMGRQQQMETAITQVGWTVSGFLLFYQQRVCIHTSARSSIRREREI